MASTIAWIFIVLLVLVIVALLVSLYKGDAVSKITIAFKNFFSSAIKSGFETLHPGQMTAQDVTEVGAAGLAESIGQDPGPTLVPTAEDRRIKRFYPEYLAENNETLGINPTMSYARQLSEKNHEYDIHAMMASKPSIDMAVNNLQVFSRNERFLGIPEPEPQITSEPIDAGIDPAASRNSGLAYSIHQ